jgi:drug/metabolite transporter (DMT)-like permease
MKRVIEIAGSPYLSAMCGLLFVSGIMVMIRGVGYDVPPIALTFWRAVIGSSVLVAVALPHLRVELPVIRDRWRPLLLCGFLQMVVGSGGTVMGLQSTTVINASVLAAFQPMITVLLACALGRDRVNRRQIVGIAISAVGVLILIAHGRLATLATLDIRSGDLWILVSVLGFSLYTAVIREAAPGMHWMSLTAAVTTFGLLCLVPLYVWEHVWVRQATFSGPMVLTAVYLGLFGTFFAVSMWNRAIRMSGPARIGAIGNLGPVFGIAAGMVFLGEELQTYHLAGAAPIAVGIWLTLFAGRGRVGPGRGQAT